MPVPDLVRLSMPVPSWMTPLKMVEVLLAPVVKVAGAPLSVTVPAPASEPIAWLKPPRSRNAPEATPTALAAENVLMAPAANVPPLIVVAPV